MSSLLPGSPFARRRLSGMPVDIVTMQEATRTVLGWSSGITARIVVTPNTDHFLRCQRDPDFAELYEQADLITLDSSILRMLMQVDGGPVADRVTGVDLFLEVVEQAARGGVPMMLIGGAPGVADQAAERLREKHPGLQVPLTLAPEPAELQDPRWIQDLAERLDRYPEKIVALCLGSPKQERLYAALRKSLPELTGVFLCVGAAIDFAAGTVSRAPRAVQSLGLEWAYRLLQEPRRLWRRYLVEDVQILRYFAAALLNRMLGRPAAPVLTPWTAPRPEAHPGQRGPVPVRQS